MANDADQNLPTTPWKKKGRVFQMRFARCLAVASRSKWWHLQSQNHMDIPSFSENKAHPTARCVSIAGTPLPAFCCRSAAFRLRHPGRGGWGGHSATPAQCTAGGWMDLGLPHACMCACACAYVRACLDLQFTLFPTTASVWVTSFFTVPFVQNTKLSNEHQTKVIKNARQRHACWKCMNTDAAKRKMIAQQKSMMLLWSL